MRKKIKFDVNFTSFNKTFQINPESLIQVIVTSFQMQKTIFQKKKNPYFSILPIETNNHYTGTAI